MNFKQFEQLDKKTIKKGFIIPGIVAVIIAILSIVFFKLGVNNVPFSEDTVRVAVSDSEEIIERTDVQKADVIRRSAFGSIERNTQLGIINFNTAPVSVIYDPYESVRADCVSLLKSSPLIGESGICTLTITKNNSSLLKDVNEGDTLSASTIYSNSEYELKAIKTEYITSLNNIPALTENIGSCVVIAADVSPGVGIYEKYYAVVFETDGGSAVVA